MKCRYFCPILTSVNEDGSVNIKDMHAMYDHVLGNGIDGILSGGSAGEFYAFTYDELQALLLDAIQYINHRGFVLAGTGRMAKSETISLSNSVLAAGADAVIIVGPYYAAATEEGIFQYYDDILGQIKGNVFMYNFPERTGYNIPARTLVRLRDRHDNFIGVKDTNAVLRHTQTYVQEVKGKYPDFLVFTGYDNNCIPNVISGGDGCIGALSNIYPAKCRQVIEALRKENLEQIKQGQREIDRLYQFYEVAPLFAPVMKWAMHELGLPMQEYMKAPMAPLTDKEKEALVGAAQELWRK